MKRLKIQFWKAEKALAMQILEQEGLPKKKDDGNIFILCETELRDNNVCLRGDVSSENFNVSRIAFNTNTERDAYLHWAVNAITDELFTGKGELKIGEMCEVSDDGKCWTNRRLLATLPKKYEMRYITTGISPTDHLSWRCARPLVKRTEPIVEECGQLVTYTWEEK